MVETVGSVDYSVLNIPCRPPGGRHRAFYRIFGGPHITPHSPLVATCFALPFIIVACSALIIGSHLFRRWCRHSPSLRPYKTPPTPLRSSGAAQEERREERGRKREEETLKQTNHSLSSYGVPVSTIEEGQSVCARRRPC